MQWARLIMVCCGMTMKRIGILGECEVDEDTVTVTLTGKGR